MPRSARALLVALPSVVAAACVVAADEPEIGEPERAAIAEGSFATGVVVAAAAALELTFRLDQVEPDDDPEEAAGRMSEHAAGLVPPCAGVELAATTVTVDFGSPPGCELPTGSEVSGTLVAGVTGPLPTVDVAFSQVAVDGRELEGTGTVSPVEEGQQTLGLELESAARELSAELVSILRTESVVLSGTIAVSGVDQETSVAITNVIFESGDCYPAGGTVVVSQPPVHLSLELTAETASSGEARVPVGRDQEVVTLPPYGDCPREGASGGD